MPQPEHDATADRADVDPLLAFNAELAAAKFPETAAVSQASAAAPSAGDAATLKERVNQAERSLARALTEIASLKSDLATLVAAVDDIRKRPSRRTDPVPVAPVKAPSRGFAGRAAAAIIFAIMLGAAIWGARLLPLFDGAQPTPIGSVHERESIAPAPLAAAPPPRLLGEPARTPAAGRVTPGLD